MRRRKRSAKIDPYANLKFVSISMTMKREAELWC
jgi:hypothetical protein